MRWTLVLLFALAACRTGGGDDRRDVIATVAGSPIYLDEFEHELQRFRAGNDDDEAGLPPETSDEAQKRALLDMLIDRRLVVRAAEEANIIVGSDAVDHAYERARSGWREAELDGLLAKKDVTPAEMKNEVRDLLLIRKYFRDEVYARVAVTDPEIEAFLSKNPEVNLRPEEVRARQILVKTEDEARAVLAEIKAGTSFEDAAIKHSITPEAKNGGDLGYFTHGEMPKFIDAACFKLNVNQMSDVVPSEYGFHLFKLVDKKPAAARPIEKVRDEVEQKLRQAKERDAQSATIAELRRKAQIVVREELLKRVI
jgi:peptidyl-prolyl cis-trans isomerase C